MVWKVSFSPSSANCGNLVNVRKWMQKSLKVISNTELVNEIIIYSRKCSCQMKKLCKCLDSGSSITKLFWSFSLMLSRKYTLWHLYLFWPFGLRGKNCQDSIKLWDLKKNSSTHKNKYYIKLLPYTIHSLSIEWNHGMGSISQNKAFVHPMIREALYKRK